MIRTLASVVLLLATADQSPAPIQEVPESPTPAPVAAKPKTSPKQKPRATAKPQASTTAPATSHRAGPYAGIWRGVISCSIWGNLEHRIVVDDAQRTMTVSKIGAGAGGANGTASTTIGTDGLTAQLPGLNGTWALKPTSDGKTAVVRLTGFMLDSSAVFTREQ